MTSTVICFNRYETKRPLDNIDIVLGNIMDMDSLNALKYRSCSWILTRLFFHIGQISFFFFQPLVVNMKIPKFFSTCFRVSDEHITGNVINIAIAKQLVSVIDQEIV